MLKAWLLLLFVCVSVGLQAQQVVSKLTVAKNQVLEISETDLQIDTLIMEDKARVVFLAPDTRLTIRNAIIGKKCSWDASAKSVRTSAQEEVNSMDGMPGRSIDAQVTFRTLGSLTIDASGADGRNGGGDGGNGGMVSLSYNSPGFPLTFNKGKKHSIHVDISGGSGGAGARLTQPAGAPDVPVQSNSQNASWDLWGNQQRASVSGEATPRASRADHGGNGDIPQPMFIQSDAQGVQYSAGGSGQPKTANQGKGWGPQGWPGKNGSFVVRRID